MKRFFLVILVGLLSFFGSWVYAAYRGVPVPYIQDEFSYLLAADTFAHGRVTNPTHPLWEHFEAFQVLQQPTYMSKYPPAPGLFMAVGQVLGGHPIYGVWLSNALMGMAICWMLYAWVPAQWAFIGGVVSILEFGMFTYWDRSYLGGAVGALAGALIFGSLPRIFRYQRTRDVIWLGLGLALLVNTRPLEGIFMAVPLGCLILPWKIKWDKIRNNYFLKKIVLPFSMIVLAVVISVGAYNKAVTGKALVSPYQLYTEHYMNVPIFIWEPLRPMPVFRHQVFYDFESNDSMSVFLSKRTWKGFWDDEKGDVGRMFIYYFGYILAIPILCFLPRALCDVKWALRFIAALFIFACSCAAMHYYVLPHYFSPITCLVVLLVVMGLRTMAIAFKSKAMNLVYLLIAVQVGINILVYSQEYKVESYGVPQQGQGIAFHEYTREEFKNMLMQMGGKHLVLVKDRPNQIFFNEWVYNAADIDHAPIVWARSMSEPKDARLLAYFRGRQIWRITVEREEKNIAGLRLFQR